MKSSFLLLIILCSGALKNAIDYLYNEWTNKAAGFVGYGGASGTRAVENLRLVMGELQVADVRAQVGLSLFTDFEKFSVFKPAPQHEKSVNAMLDQVNRMGRRVEDSAEVSTMYIHERRATSLGNTCSMWSSILLFLLDSYSGVSGPRS